jgi:hypothetical protein
MRGFPSVHCLLLFFYYDFTKQVICQRADGWMFYTLLEFLFNLVVQCFPTEMADWLLYVT